MKTSIITAKMLLLSAIGLAQTQNFWQETNHFPTDLNGIGNISIASDSNNSIYVGTVESGIFKSTDQGNSWQNVLNAIDTSIVKIKVINQDLIYAIGANVFFKSTNSGQSWTRTAINTTFPLTDLEVIENGKILVSSAAIVDIDPVNYNYFGDGIFISNDGGQNWTQKNLGLSSSKAITQIAVSKTNVIFAFMASFSHSVGALYYSTNEGESWEKLNAIKFKGYASGETIQPSSFYESYCMEFDQNNQLHFSFEGVSGSFSVSGGIKNSIDKILLNEFWEIERINQLGYEWQFHPFHSIYFSKNQNHTYSSLNTYNSVSFGGAYLKSNENAPFQQIKSGVTPVLNSLLKMHYTEDSNGRIYSIQHLDHRVYFSDYSLSTSVEDTQISDTKSFNIYPNPAESFVNIQTIDKKNNIKSIMIFDTNGKMVDCLNNLNVESQKINISELPKGVYFLQINSQEGRQTEKLLVW